MIEKQIKSQAATGFQAFIVYYRDDPDRQNLVDWVQDQWLGCCGVDGPKGRFVFSMTFIKLYLT